uniref:Uncharacterized protein n=1 Tax=Sphaerodactylus townsendi TaxID=933632 RepID=A0ACB8E9I2_9SAUR
MPTDWRGLGKTPREWEDPCGRSSPDSQGSIAQAVKGSTQHRVFIPQESSGQRMSCTEKSVSLPGNPIIPVHPRKLEACGQCHQHSSDGQPHVWMVCQAQRPKERREGSPRSGFQSWAISRPLRVCAATTGMEQNGLDVSAFIPVVS